MDDDYSADPEAGSQYEAWETISPTGIRSALGSLMLFDDPNLRNQAFNLAIVDVFCMQLESQLLKKQFHEERTPLPDVAFLSAQSQMWIFAAYELVRTWRKRAKDILKWQENGGLEAKLAHLRGDLNGSMQHHPTITEMESCMKYRPKFSEQQRWEVWRRWKCGETTRHIARSMGTYPGVIFAVIEPCGGVFPRRRCRSRRALSLADREEISRGICEHRSIREIARRIGRAPSTVSREIARNTRAWWRYRAHLADRRAWGRALRPKQCHLARNPRLAVLVAQKLQLDWSPQQISGWLAREFGNDESMQVSHETIYRSLFVQARGVLKKQLVAHLRRSYGVRRGRHYRAQRAQGRGQIKDAVSIRERPAQVEDRAVPGHWEGDLLEGSGHTQIATLVERQSRFVILAKVPHSDTKTVVRALTRKMRKLPQQLRRSLTWDRGKEMAAHKSFSLSTDLRVYFCDPASPWQRGSNENTNGLLRQYFRKKTDLSGYSQAQLDKVALKLNQRPRETLGFDTPANKLQAHVASTH